MTQEGGPVSRDIKALPDGVYLQLPYDRGFSYALIRVMGGEVVHSCRLSEHAAITLNLRSKIPFTSDENIDQPQKRALVTGLYLPKKALRMLGFKP